MEQRKIRYHSNGKLLLTGEYLVLKGAKALAIPTKFGQDLKVQVIDEPKLYWESYDEKGQIWFQIIFQLPLNKTDTQNSIALTLFQILQQAQKQNPDFLSKKQGFKVKTKLNFPRNWGLGTSSTLLNNIAQWATIDVFELLQNTLGGSGYDVACAMQNTPIQYQLKENKATIFNTPFNPVAFQENLYFVHLNQKQNSQAEVVNFSKNDSCFKVEISEISKLTNLIEKAKSLSQFEEYLYQHEQIIGAVLQRKPIQKALFNDYFGQIKSLGAWGGDFVLATGNDDTPAYFKKKGYKTVLLYEEISLK